jgi:hypothetical protein
MAAALQDLFAATKGASTTRAKPLAASLIIEAIFAILPWRAITNADPERWRRQ